MFNNLKFTLDIYKKRFNIFIISRKINIKVRLKSILDYDEDILKWSKSVKDVHMYTNNDPSYQHLVGTMLYNKLMSRHEKYTKHHFESIKSYPSKFFTDEDLALMICTLYLESDKDEIKFYRLYRDYDFMYRNSHKELFDRIDKIILESTELFTRNKRL